MIKRIVALALIVLVASPSVGLAKEDKPCPDVGGDRRDCPQKNE